MKIELPAVLTENDAKISFQLKKLFISLNFKNISKLLENKLKLEQTSTKLTTLQTKYLYFANQTDSCKLLTPTLYTLHYSALHFTHLSTLTRRIVHKTRHPHSRIFNSYSLYCPTAQQLVALQLLKLI